MYSLLCRQANLGTLSANALNDDISSQNTELSRMDSRASSYLKHLFDKYQSSRTLLLLFALLGASMVITDGILTPSIAGTTSLPPLFNNAYQHISLCSLMISHSLAKVLSAVNGIKIKAQGMHEGKQLFFLQKRRYMRVLLVDASQLF